MTPRIGIIQGRLLPPINEQLQAFPTSNWRSEFPLASAAQVDCIEWIFDQGSENDNPIWDSSGLVDLQNLIAKYSIEVRSICADYFMRQPLIFSSTADMEQRSSILDKLIDKASSLKIHRIVIPFVDSSSIQTNKDWDAAIEILRSSGMRAARVGVELHLETDMSPNTFALFLEKINQKNVKVNYDSGNSAGIGYSPEEEIAAYGDSIGSVHIKDRVLNGSSVPLGQGDAKFEELFFGLKERNYTGDFILQTARGKNGSEVALTRKNRKIVLGWVKEIWN